MRPDVTETSSSTASWQTAEKALRLILYALAALFLLLFLYTALKRLRFPFELEWIESGMLTSTLRIVHGQGLYVAPSLHFVPYLYAPVYLYVTAALTRLTGLGANDYSALRAVSILSSLGTVLAIGALVWTETRNRLAAIAGASLYLSAYSIMGSFFDIGRVDSLFVFVITLALLLQRRGHLVLAALVWVVAFQTKQSVLPLAFVILLAEWRRPRQLGVALAVFAVAALGSVLALNHATDGWYVFYIFRVAQGLGIVGRQALLYWPDSVFEQLTGAWALIVAAALLTRVSWRGATAGFYLLVSFALYGGIWFVESHRGASTNALMPVFAWTSVLFGIAVGRLLRAANTLARPQPGGEPALLQHQLTVLILFAAAVQIFSFMYYPGWFIPPPVVLTAAQDLVHEVASLPGQVYVLNHSHDAVLAGKEPFAEGEALGAVLDAHLGSVSADLRRQFDQQMASHQYTAVVIDDARPVHTSWGAERTYPLAISVPLLQAHSMTSQPQWFLLPCDAAPAEIATLTQQLTARVDENCPGQPNAQGQTRPATKR